MRKSSRLQSTLNPETLNPKNPLNLTPKALKEHNPRSCEILQDLVAEWIHFALFGVILPTIKLKL